MSPAGRVPNGSIFGGEFLANLGERLRSRISWLLIAVFLCQPVLTYLVTPVAVHTAQGFRAVICTLKGTQKDVIVDLPSIDDQQQAADDCPAIKLIQLAGIAVAPELHPEPALVLYLIGLLNQTGGHAHHRVHFSAYSTRAPPLA